MSPNRPLLHCGSEHRAPTGCLRSRDHPGAQCHVSTVGTTALPPTLPRTQARARTKARTAQGQISRGTRQICQTYPDCNHRSVSAECLQTKISSVQSVALAVVGKRDEFVCGSQTGPDRFRHAGVVLLIVLIDGVAEVHPEVEVEASCRVECIEEPPTPIAARKYRILQLLFAVVVVVVVVASGQRYFESADRRVCAAGRERVEIGLALNQIMYIHLHGIVAFSGRLDRPIEGNGTPGKMMVGRGKSGQPADPYRTCAAESTLIAGRAGSNARPDDDSSLQDTSVSDQQHHEMISDFIPSHRHASHTPPPAWYFVLNKTARVAQGLQPEGGPQTLHRA